MVHARNSVSINTHSNQDNIAFVQRQALSIVQLFSICVYVVYVYECIYVCVCVCLSVLCMFSLVIISVSYISCWLLVCLSTSVSQHCTLPAHSITNTSVLYAQQPALNEILFCFGSDTAKTAICFVKCPQN